MPLLRRKRFARKPLKKRAGFKRTFGKSFRARVMKVINRVSETKYYDIGSDNQNLYHDVGKGTGPTQNQISLYSDFWGQVPQGAGRNRRVGDKLTPLGIKLRIWLANKLDRPNIHYRIVLVTLPRNVNGTIPNGSNIDLFPIVDSGSMASTLIAPLDMEKITKVWIDRVVKVEMGNSEAISGGASVGKESHRVFTRWIPMRKSRHIQYDNNGGNTRNNIMHLYVIPYDSFGTLQTDNIASCSFHARLYFKDL